MISNLLFSQTNFDGSVITITGGNSFKAIDKEKNTFEVVLNDTALFDDDIQNKLAKDYLENKILGKNVFITIMSMEGNKIYGSVLYNCKQQRALQYKKNDIPCSEGNVLDIEMIELGFIKYIGQNDYLKKISKQ
jgi:hypothetical protein